MFPWTQSQTVLFGLLMSSLEGHQLYEAYASHHCGYNSLKRKRSSQSATAITVHHGLLSNFKMSLAKEELNREQLE